MIKYLFILALALPLTLSQGSVREIPSDVHCKAVALWFEARGESPSGQRAVLDVIRNRMKESGKSACEVIKKPYQFSFVSPSTNWVANKQQLELWYKVKELDKTLDEEYYWFLRHDLRRVWMRNMECKKIGLHKFCKLK